MSRSGFTKSFDDIPIYFEIHGASTPTLLFVHGWSCNNWFWSKQIDHFTPRYSVVTLDLAGHGSSGTERSKWVAEAFAQDIVAVTSELELDKIILVGHSLAGEVILEASLLLSEKVIGIVAVDAFTNPEDKVAEEQIQNDISAFREDFQDVVSHIVQNMLGKGSNPSLLEKIRSIMLSAPPDIAIPAWEEMLRYENRRYPAVFNEISGPFMIFNCKRRQVQVEEFRKFVPDITVRYLPDVGHFLMLEDPNAFNAILKKFVEKVTLS